MSRESRSKSTESDQMKITQTKSFYLSMKLEVNALSSKKKNVDYSSFNKTLWQKQYQFNLEQLELVEESNTLIEHGAITRPLESL